MKNNSRYSITLVLCVLLLLLTSRIKAQDRIEIDSTGITINGHYLGKPIDDTLNGRFSVRNFRKIIKKPYKNVKRSNTADAIVKNNGYTKFLRNYSVSDKSMAPILEIGHTYVTKKFLTVKILDLEIDNNTTYTDVLNSSLFKSAVENRNGQKVDTTSYSFHFHNILNLNTNVMINVADKPDARIFDVWIYFKDFHKLYNTEN